MNPPTNKRRALGRGLSALLPNTPTPAAARTQQAAARTYFRAPIEEVYPAPDQPRRRFAEEQLEQLAQSIRSVGIIQPLVVRTRSEADGGGWSLIAGERRWRAAQRAGLGDVPVVVLDVDSHEAFERALIENLQRADLNPIEEATAYLRLVESHSMTQEQVAERVGKDRSTVANSLRLLKLPDAVRHMVEEQQLSMGHARALLGLTTAGDMETVARTVVAKQLSVRATEALVRKRVRGDDGGARKQAGAAPKKSAAVRDLENRLTRSLGAQISLSQNTKGKGGRIEIRYMDLDDLDRLLEKLL